MNSMIVSALRMLLALTALCGAAYPLAVTGLARCGFARQAEGSLVVLDGRPVGSRWLAQSFTNADYFQPRPSAAQYATLPSGAGNQSGTSAKLQQEIQTRMAYWKVETDNNAPVPPDLLTASGSGLDPHISMAAALFQLARVARARGFNRRQTEECRSLIQRQTEGPQWGFLGESRINVLLLNCAVDEYDASHHE
jgi:potassium-transporting ATPase KdpC subunit